MYNNRHGCRDNWRKEYVASNQVVGGSSPSGRAIFSMIYNVSENFTLRLKPDSPIQIYFLCIMICIYRGFESV